MSRASTLTTGICLTIAVAAFAAPIILAADGSGEAPSSLAVKVEIDAEGRIQTTAQAAGTEAPAAASRVLVKFRPGQAARFGPEAAGQRGFARHPDLYAVTLRPGKSVAEAVREYRSRPDVLYAEPDYLASIAAVPTDPRWPEQWGPPMIRAPEAWDTHTDAGDVVVAVIDTGVDFTHPDLAGNLWTDSVTGAHGYTFEDGVETEDGSDVHGHGTHVAGILGAAANNGVGIAGLNWSVQILSLRFIGANGLGSVSDAILAFDKIVALRQAGYNIRLSNNSWGVGAYSQALEDAMAQAAAAGVLHVCAAGNWVFNIDANSYYPASFDGTGILTVSASNDADGLPLFSGYGLARVDLAAPGEDVLSTVPTGTCSLCDPSGYRLLSGTSMATPHVAGVLAAAFHLNPALQPAEARAVLLDPGSYAALSPSSLVSWSTTGGRLDYAATLANPALYAPPANAFPTATTTSVLARPAGDDVTLSLASDDADGDVLRERWARWRTVGLLGTMMSDTVPTAGSYPDPLSFVAPSWARAGHLEYVGSVADGRGGSALATSRLTLLPTASPGLPPSGQLVVTPTEGPPGTAIELSWDGADPEGGDLRWEYSGVIGGCCFTSTTTGNVTMANAGVYRFNGRAIDPELQVSATSSVVVRIGGALGEPPVAVVSVDATDGAVPLTVNYDASASYDPDGGGLTYYVFCDLTTGLNSADPGPPTGSCTYDQPGPHRMVVSIYDDSGYRHSHEVDIMTTLPPDVVAPAAPTGLAATGGPEEILLDWADSPEEDLFAYRVYRSTTEGGGYAQVGGDTAASQFLDTGLVAGTPYYYVVTAVDGSNNESAPSIETTAAPAYVNLATADFATPAGTLLSDFTLSHAQDDSSQRIREELSGGKPSNRYSHLEHVWQFDVLAGVSYAFHVDAHHTASADGDDFLFEYSTDGSSYAPMLTVTRTADDDGYQVFGFPGDVSGTLYVRARDSDHTAGSQSLDTLSVDHMLVSTAAASGPDVTPPAAPTGLAATPGDGQVSLDWNDNSEPDLAGYHVHRATAAGGPYTRLNGSLLAASSYVDATAVNGTTYYYVASAEDASGNESALSAEVSATPQAGGASAHVDSIVLSTVGGRKVKARAVVTVLDDGGAPVAGADVTGSFSGDFAETLTGTTDSAGAVTLTTGSRVTAPVSFTFCVDDVAHATLAYDPAANVETCDSF